MRTDLQIEASRANGSKSRGPITDEGKLASSRNAYKHGLLSETVLLYGEEEETFHAFNLEFIAALQPTNAVEKDLVDTMAVARWRRMRIWNLEKTTLELQMDREDDKHPSPRCTPEVLASRAFSALADNSRSLDLINRYESRYDRQYHRAFRSLRDLRKNPQPTPPADVAAPGPAAISRGEGPAATNRGPELAPTDAPDTTNSHSTPSVSAGNPNSHSTPSVSAGNPNSAKRTQPAPEPAHISRTLWLKSFPKSAPEPAVFHAQGGLAPS